MEYNLQRVLAGVDAIREQIPAIKPAPVHQVVTIDEVLAALNSFSTIVRYLNTRRSKAANLVVTDEAGVQDAIYLMLRPWILDLTFENPTDKVANRFTIKDFVSPAGRFVIEAKFVRNAEHGKAIGKEINDDIETYRYHRHCDDLIFFIYDPDSNIPDVDAVKRHVNCTRNYDSRLLRCHSVIWP